MIVSNIYAVCLLISAILIIVMAAKNYSNIDIYYCAIVLMVPVSLLGYWLRASAVSVDEARLAVCLLYLDSTILPVLMLFSMLKSLRIKAAAWIKILAYGLAILHLFIVWTCRENSLYYASFDIEKTPYGTVMVITDGPLKIIHYIFLGMVAAAIIAVLTFCVINRGKYSRETLITYSLVTASAVLIYVLEVTNNNPFSVLPVFYTIVDIFISIDYEHVHSHDIDCVVIDQQKEYSKRGYIAFDKKNRLLCYNDIALQYLPELGSMQIDSPIILDAAEKGDPDSIKNMLFMLLGVYQITGESADDFTRGEITYRATVMDFFLRRSGNPVGRLIEIQDVSAEHAYNELMKEYGMSLSSEVKDQTERIRYIQNRVVLGMATIIENRDMNTGGHVRRTSDIIKIIVEEMQKQGRTDIDDRFADEVIRSAPMHDLGKISIDNDILCKPGRLTDEEYAVMKTHSARSGEIVKAILSGVEDPHFVNTAYCLARFHHERWDGRGYPEGLMETEIPLEARIMAVADVYDALVSKRCYKEPMSFEKAAEIMTDGMGTQFDPGMKPIFEGCRKELEAYYTAANAAEQEADRS